MSAEFTHRIEDCGLTEKETLWYRESEERFEEMLHQPDTHIHEVTVTTNNYGEFLFVKVSRPAQDPNNAITFYGLGLHEQRDRWITGEWFWYSGRLYEQTKSAQVSVGYADSLIEGRKAEIAGYVAQHQQGGEGRFFETLADIADDDGVMAELEDFDNLRGDLNR